MEISKSKISRLASLSSRKMRRKYGMFLVEGTKCVIDTLESFDLEILCATEGWIENNSSLTERYADRVFTAKEQDLRKISAMQSVPEAVAAFRIPDNADADNPEIDETELYLLLDDIQDPGNMGTIIRTADWFGIRTVFASKGTVDIYNSKCVQATMGSLSRVKVVYTDLSGLIEENPQIPVYGTLLDGKNIFTESHGKSGFIVFGNEGNGISQELRKRISKPLLIPPYDPASHGESLNVAASVAIVLSVFRNG